MISAEAIERLDPSHHYLCEHPDHPEIPCLTWRTESSERYCGDHFPWDEGEKDAALAVVNDTTGEP